MTNQLNENVKNKNVNGEKPIENEKESKSQTTDVLLAKDVKVEDLKNMDKFPCVIERQTSKKSNEVYKIKFGIGNEINSIVKEIYITQTVYNLMFRKHKFLKPDNRINSFIARGRIFRGTYADGNIWVRVQIFIWEGKQFNFFLKNDELEMFKDLVKNDEFMYKDKVVKVGDKFENVYKKFTIIDSKEELTEDNVDNYIESWQSNE